MEDFSKYTYFQLTNDKKMERDTRVCPWWQAYFFDNWLRKLFHNSEKMFYPYLKEGMTAVDIGCGMGYFSIGMAKIVGNNGHVFSIDLQPQMLNTLRKRAIKHSFDQIIHLHQCDGQSLDINLRADFVLSFWMVHEVPEPKRLLQQIFSILKEKGKYFLSEPKFHVSRQKAEEISCLAAEVGFKKISEPKVAFSRSFIYEK